MVTGVIMRCRLAENGVLTDCSIKTQEPEETLDFNFASENVVNKIIIKVRIYSTLLRYLLDDMIELY